jgi:sugar phosphate isomerase/epimerase
MANRVKLAFSTLACPRWSLDQIVAGARRYGYEGVELRLIDGELIDGAMPAPERERVRRTFADAGLPIVAIDSSVRVAAAPDTEGAIDELRTFLDLAAEWESPMVRVFGGEWDASGSRPQAVAQARRVLEEAMTAAQPLGVAIALETHDRFSSAALVAEVLDGLPPDAAAIWDVGHPHRVGDSPADVLRLLDGRIAHVHIKDCRRKADSDDWQLTLLGEGEVPVRECIDALREADYLGWLSVEWEKHWHPELAEPEVALPQFADMLRSWDVER